MSTSTRIKIQGDFFAVQSQIEPLMAFLDPQMARQRRQNPYWDTIQLFRKLRDGRVQMREFDTGSYEGTDPDDFLDADLETRWLGRDFGGKIIHESFMKNKKALEEDGMQISEADTYANIRTFNAYRVGDAPTGLGFSLVAVPVLVEVFHFDPSDAERISAALLAGERTMLDKAVAARFFQWTGWKTPEMAEFGEEDRSQTGEAILARLEKDFPAELRTSERMLEAAEFITGSLWGESEAQDDFEDMEDDEEPA